MSDFLSKYIVRPISLLFPSALHARTCSLPCIQFSISFPGTGRLPDFLLLCYDAKIVHGVHAPLGQRLLRTAPHIQLQGGAQPSALPAARLQGMLQKKRSQ